MKKIISKIKKIAKRISIWNYLNFVNGVIFLVGALWRSADSPHIHVLFWVSGLAIGSSVIGAAGDNLLAMQREAMEEFIDGSRKLSQEFMKEVMGIFVVVPAKEDKDATRH